MTEQQASLLRRGDYIHHNTYLDAHGRCQQWRVLKKPDMDSEGLKLYIKHPVWFECIVSGDGFRAFHVPSECPHMRINDQAEPLRAGSWDVSD